MIVRVDEARLRSIIRNILKENILIFESENLPSDFPIDEFDLISDGIRKTGVKKAGGYAIGLAAISLRRGDNSKFATYLMCANPAIYRIWYTIFNAQLKDPGPTVRAGDRRTDTFDLGGIFAKSASALNFMGRSDLEPDLRNVYNNWKKSLDSGETITLPNIPPSDSAAVVDFIRSQSKEKPKGSSSADSKGQAPSGVEKYTPDAEFLGKRFSYEMKGVPELTVVAKLGNRDFIAKVYEPTATVKDPVGSGKGVLLSFDVFQQIKKDLYDWDERFARLMNEVMVEISKSSQLGGSGTTGANMMGQSLYEKYKIFVPIVPIYPPISESTEYAYQKSLSFGCTLEKDELVKQLLQVFAAAATRVTPLIDAATDELDVQPDFPDADRLIPCIKDYTADSFIYGIINTVVGFLGPIGATVGVAMDIVPGIILTAYFIKRRNIDLAITYAIWMIVSLVMPVALNTPAKKIAQKFEAAVPDVDEMVLFKDAEAVSMLLGIGIAVPLALIINKLSSYFGDGTVFTSGEMEDYIKKIVSGKTVGQLQGSAQDEMKKLTLSGVLDPQGLRAKYPATY